MDRPRKDPNGRPTVRPGSYTRDELTEQLRGASLHTVTVPPGFYTPEQLHAFLCGGDR